jgi:hypothetical protein
MPPLYTASVDALSSLAALASAAATAAASASAALPSALARAPQPPPHQQQPPPPPPQQQLYSPPAAAAPSALPESRTQSIVRGVAIGFFLAALLLSPSGDDAFGAAVAGSGVRMIAPVRGGGGGGLGFGFGGGGGGAHASASASAALDGEFVGSYDGACGARTQCGVTWVPVRNASAVATLAPPLGPALGCPATGLCRLTDVFDEVVVLTLPRRERQLRRLRSQLRELGVPHVEVEGFDKLTAAAQAAWAFYIRDRVVVDLGYDSLGELCVGFGWLAILERIVNRGSARTLVLEDDAIFHREFDREFDRKARAVPQDWLLFYLGATQTLWGEDGAQWPPADEVPEYYKLVNAWGAFAVGVSHEAAVEMLAQHRKFDCRIDICTLPFVTKKNVGRCVAAYPHIVIADVRFSDLRGASGDIAGFAKTCRWSLEMFDLDKGYERPPWR